MTAITQTLDADGILLLTIDCPGLSMNVINADLATDLAAAVARIKTAAFKSPILLKSMQSGS